MVRTKNPNDPALDQYAQALASRVRVSRHSKRKYRSKYMIIHMNRLFNIELVERFDDQDICENCADTPDTLIGGRASSYAYKEIDWFTLDGDRWYRKRTATWVEFELTLCKSCLKAFFMDIQDHRNSAEECIVEIYLQTRLMEHREEVRANRYKELYSKCQDVFK